MDDILNTIPHRPPFLFIDEIIECTQDGAIAKRIMREDEPHFQGHYPGNPLMPGVLLAEAVFQTAAYYISKRMQAQDKKPDGKIPVLVRINKAKYKQMVHPGDTITIHVSYLKEEGLFIFLRGKILKSDGKTAMTIEYVLSVVDEEKAS